MNKKELQVFNFEDQPIRTVEFDGVVMWAATDVCKALDISNVYQAVERLDDDDVCLTDTVDSLGKRQCINFVTESGLYSLIMGSRKEEAKRFKKWVTSEVLPSIRKTGKYSVKQDVDKDALSYWQKELVAAVEIAKTFGLEGNQALIAANRMVRHLYNKDLLEISGNPILICDKQDIHLTATDIAVKLNTTAQQINAFAVSAGYIESSRDSKGRLQYRPSDKGKDICLLKDVEIPGRKTPKQQLMYYSSAIELFSGQNFKKPKK